MPVILAQTDSDIQDCWPVMAQLRPHLNEEDFISAVRKQSHEGYRLAFIRTGQSIEAIAGFRILQSLSWGRFCYVDDLVTDERKRSEGLGSELFAWLCEYARAQGCERLELDSGVQRFAAHRFYFERRMFISCYHFSLALIASK